MRPATIEESGAITGAALRAEADAASVSIGEVVRRTVRTRIEARERPGWDSLPGRTWRAIEPAVRGVLVMLAADQQGDPHELARQPWEAFSPQDQAAIASCARSFARELKHAAALF